MDKCTRHCREGHGDFAPAFDPLFSDRDFFASIVAVL